MGPRCSMGCSWWRSTSSEKLQFIVRTLYGKIEPSSIQAFATISVSNVGRLAPKLATCSSAKNESASLVYGSIFQVLWFHFFAHLCCCRFCPSCCLQRPLLLLWRWWCEKRKSPPFNLSGSFVRRNGVMYSNVLKVETHLGWLCSGCYK